MADPDKPPPARPSTPFQGKREAETRTIPVIQEEASISRVAEETGKALRVRVVSHEERQQVPVTEILEEISVEHVAINRYVNERTEPREEGGVLIIPVFETVPVVEERLLLKEEVRVVRHRREVQREEEVVLRKEVPIVEYRASGEDEWRQDPSDR